MMLGIKMDSLIDRGVHYISPGGYCVNGKNFDFNQSKGTINKENLQMVYFDLTDFDGNLGTGEYENVPSKITKEDVLYGNWEDFYIYTGEYDDPEINVDEITKVQFFFSDNSVISADEELLGKINKIIE